MGTGIAGVGLPAEYKGEGIMLIKERSKYREWEFIYDPKEDKNIVGPAGTPGMGGPGMGGPGMGNPGFGNPTGSGNSTSPGSSTPRRP